MWHGTTVFETVFNGERERESDKGREERLGRRECNSLRRERETVEERHARFVSTNLSLITFSNGIKIGRLARQRERQLAAS